MQSHASWLQQPAIYIPDGKPDIGNSKGRKNLGVIFSEDLKPSRQCQQAYSKPSKVLGILGRTITYKN